MENIPVKSKTVESCLSGDLITRSGQLSLGQLSTNLKTSNNGQIE